MPKLPLPARPDPSRFEQRIGELRNQLVGAEPLLIADRTGARFQRTGDETGFFYLDLWKQPVSISYPEYQAFQAASKEALSAFNTALLLYYFSTADGTPLDKKWISFSELPDGRFYSRAFQGYSGNELAGCFQNDRQAFELAAEKLDGKRQVHGDAAFQFQALPRVPILVVQWLGDEDFPASFQILFDSAAHHYLPTDAYAILGSTITRHLISAAHR